MTLIRNSCSEFDSVNTARPKNKLTAWGVLFLDHLLDLPHAPCHLVQPPCNKTVMVIDETAIPLLLYWSLTL